MQFLVYSDKVTSADAAATAALHRSVIAETSYHEPTRLILSNKTVTARQALGIELDVISGAVAALIVLLRPASGSAAHATFHTFSSGQLGLRTPGGESVYGSGSAVDEDYLREVIQSGYFDTSLADKMPRVLPSFLRRSSGRGGVRASCGRVSALHPGTLCDTHLSGTCHAAEPSSRMGSDCRWSL